MESSTSGSIPRRGAGRLAAGRDVHLAGSGARVGAHRVRRFVRVVIYWPGPVMLGPQPARESSKPTRIRGPIDFCKARTAQDSLGGGREEVDVTRASSLQTDDERRAQVAHVGLAVDAAPQVRAGHLPERHRYRSWRFTRPENAKTHPAALSKITFQLQTSSGANYDVHVFCGRLGTALIA